MSLISDFIIPPNLFATKGITTLELSTLLAILEGEEWQEALLDLFSQVPNTGNLFRVSDALLSRLTDFDYDIDQVAADWADTEELKVEPEQARSFIDGFAQHALRAQRLRKPIHLWNCI
jgi:hypothetical protein